MSKPPSAESILKNMKKQSTAPSTPIASGMHLPNLSGDHSAGIVRTTPINNLDIANKAYVDAHLTANAVTSTNVLTANTILQGNDGTRDIKTSTATVAQIAANVVHSASNGTDHSDVVLNNTHRASAGTDHSDVGLNNTHRASNGTNHANVVLNDAHRASSSQAHSDYMLNTGDTATGDYTINNLYSPIGANVGIGESFPNSKLEIRTDSLGVTPSTASGLNLKNAAAAAAAAQQISPAIRWMGKGWKTDATAASQSVDFDSYVVPVQGTANPTGYLTFRSSINNAAYADKMVLTSAGNLGIGTTAPAGKLEVSGSGDICSYITTTGIGNAAVQFLRSGDGTTSGKYAYTLLQALQTSPQRWNVGMIGTTDYYVQDSTAGTTPFVVKATTGNVGIGTTGPTGLLHLYSTSASGTQFKLQNADTGGREWLLLSAGSGNSEGAGAFSILDNTAGERRLTISTSGNVGIGTTAPTSKLQVVGLPVYANNAAAVTGGLTAGAFYRTGADPDPVCVVH